MQLRAYLETRPDLTFVDLYDLCAAVDPPLEPSNTNKSSRVKRHVEGSGGIDRPNPDWVHRYSIVTEGAVTAQDWQDQHFQTAQDPSEQAAA